MKMYSGWCMTHTGEQAAHKGSAACPLCGRIPDVVTFSCPVCERDNLCFYHRRGARTWRASGREVAIRECCVQCWTEERRHRGPEIAAIKRVLFLELVGRVVLCLAIGSLALLFLSARLGIVAIATSALLLTLVAWGYFRAGRSLPDISDEDVESAGKARS